MPFPSMRTRPQSRSHYLDLQYDDMEDGSHFLRPQNPYPPFTHSVPRQHRRALPCLVPDIDLVCDETLSEDEHEEETIWTQLKDSTSLSFWETEEIRTDPTVEANISRHRSTSPVADCRATSPPPKKRRTTTAHTLGAAGEEVPVGQDKDEDPAGGWLQLQCRDSEDIKVEAQPVAVLQISETTGGEVGQQAAVNGRANIRRHAMSPQKEARCARNHKPDDTELQVADDNLSWEQDDDFHTVPSVEVGGASLNHITPPSSQNRVIDISEICLQSEERVTTYSPFPHSNPSTRPDSDGYFEQIESPRSPDSTDSYVIYSNQSSDESESENEVFQRPLASCDATDHVVPNIVIEE